MIMAGDDVWRKLELAVSEWQLVFWACTPRG